MSIKQIALCPVESVEGLHIPMDQWIGRAVQWQSFHVLIVD